MGPSFFGSVRLVPLAMVFAWGACAPLDSGVYLFEVEGEVESTCGLEPPSSWEGRLEVRTETLLLSIFDPFFEGAAGGQSLIGRSFEGRGDQEQFILDAGFDTLLNIGGLSCPAFYQVNLMGDIVDSELFLGVLSTAYSIQREASLDCPRSCAVNFPFTATRLRGL